MTGKAPDCFKPSPQAPWICDWWSFEKVRCECFCFPIGQDKPVCPTDGLIHKPRTKDEEDFRRLMEIDFEGADRG